MIEINVKSILTEHSPKYSNRGAIMLTAQITTMQTVQLCVIMNYCVDSDKLDLHIQACDTTTVSSKTNNKE